MYETILHCRNCGAEHRLVAEDVVAERDRLRAACRHVIENCYCQPSGQHCDVCRPAALALLEERDPARD